MCTTNLLTSNLLLFYHQHLNPSFIPISCLWFQALHLSIFLCSQKSYQPLLCPPAFLMSATPLIHTLLLALIRPLLRAFWWLIASTRVYFSVLDNHSPIYLSLFALQYKQMLTFKLYPVVRALHLGSPIPQTMTRFHA